MSESSLWSLWSLWSLLSQKKIYITMTQYRYQLERYRGRSTRHVCPQCGRKNVFTRYIDTYNNNIYINDKVGKCNRLDKCGYHYTPHQYFTDNPWKRDKDCLFVYLHRENKQTNKTPPPEPKRSEDSDGGCNNICRVLNVLNDHPHHSIP